MQLEARTHFEAIVLPAVKAYEQAEQDLTRSIVDAHEEEAQTLARYAALRQGGAAVLFLHHFSDIVAKRPPDHLPDFGGDEGRVREWLDRFSTEQIGTSDVKLLGDIADALKHAVLTRRLPREVEEAGQVLTTGRGYGTGRFGEGKFGGVDEVWVLCRSGQRPLSAIFSSVVAAWKLALAV